MSDAGFFGGKKKNNGPPAVPKPEHPLSDTYAAAAEAVKNLEHDLAASERECREWQARAEAAEKEAVRLERRVQQLQIERDNMHGELKNIEGMVAAGSEVYLKILTHIKPDIVAQFRPKPEGERRVVRALADMNVPDDQVKAPDWLSRKQQQEQPEK